jgi:hypothetical protein
MRLPPLLSQTNEKQRQPLALKTAASAMADIQLGKFRSVVEGMIIKYNTIP